MIKARFWNQARVAFAAVQFDTALVLLIALVEYRYRLGKEVLVPLLFGLVGLSRLPAAIAVRREERKDEDRDDDDEPPSALGGSKRSTPKRALMVTSILLTVIFAARAWAQVFRGRAS